MTPRTFSGRRRAPVSTGNARTCLRALRVTARGHRSAAISFDVPRARGRLRRDRDAHGRPPYRKRGAADGVAPLAVSRATTRAQGRDHGRSVVRQPARDPAAERERRRDASADVAWTGPPAWLAVLGRTGLAGAGRRSCSAARRREHARPWIDALPQFAPASPVLCCAPDAAMKGPRDGASPEIHRSPDRVGCGAAAVSLRAHPRAVRRGEGRRRCRTAARMPGGSSQNDACEVARSSDRADLPRERANQPEGPPRCRWCAPAERRSSPGAFTDGPSSVRVQVAPVPTSKRRKRLEPRRSARRWRAGFLPVRAGSARPSGDRCRLDASRRRLE